MSTDENPRHERLIELVALIGPVIEEYLRGHADFDVAYIVLAAPAGVRHKTQAFVTNIATNEAAKGLLTNAVEWLDEQGAKCLH